MNKEYFVKGQYLIVLDDEGNIKLKNKTNNPKGLLERENRLEQINNKLEGREKLIFSLPDAIMKREDTLEEAKEHYTKYLNMDNRLKEFLVWGNVLSLSLTLVSIANEALASEMLQNCALECTFLIVLNGTVHVIEKKIRAKQKIYTKKMSEINEQLANYQQNLTNIKEEAYELRSLKKNIPLDALKEEKPLQEGVVYSFNLKEPEERKVSKKRLEEQKHLLESLAKLVRENPKMSLQEVKENYAEVYEKEEDLCLKLFKKDL